MRKDIFLIVKFNERFFKVYLDGEITPIEGSPQRYTENHWTKNEWNKRKKEIVMQGKILGLFKSVKIDEEHRPCAGPFLHTGSWHPVWRSEEIKDEILKRHFIGIVKRFINKQFPIEIPRSLV